MWGWPRGPSNELGMSAAIDNPMDSSPAETFTASRWTQGNFFFPTKLVISPQRVSRVKSRLFGSNEESIAMSKIASVHISTGVFWSEIVIESTGGTDPITSHGHRKADAQRIRDLIETYQGQARV
ncbi:MAG TPA: PH domain-containing protein [Candidatus Acidoferrum sp.]|nr:PH domain-containing protein [Candidatus Acidoferrum sp.]